MTVNDLSLPSARPQRFAQIQKNLGVLKISKTDLFRTVNFIKIGWFLAIYFLNTTKNSRNHEVDGLNKSDFAIFKTPRFVSNLDKFGRVIGHFHPHVKLNRNGL